MKELNLAIVRCEGQIAQVVANIAELDVNPIKVLPRDQGCVVVDALIVPRGSRAEEPP